METKQTAVEWLAQILDIAPDNPLLTQAKAMEKEQMIDARNEGYAEGWDEAANYVARCI